MEKLEISDILFEILLYRNGICVHNFYFHYKGEHKIMIECLERMDQECHFGLLKRHLLSISKAEPKPSKSKVRLHSGSQAPL